MLYIILFIIVIIVNILPAFAPPTWTLIVFFLNYFGLNIYLVIFLAVIAATTGRFFLFSYSGWLARQVFNKWEQENLKLLGKKLGVTPLRNFLVIFIYSITPLSTTAHFVAAGLVKIKKTVILSGFAC